MSTYMIDPQVPPGQYQMGRVSDDEDSQERRISNHRFIGVDRILAHPESVNDERDIMVNGAITESGTLPDISSITTANADQFPDLNIGTLGPSDVYDARTVLLQKAVEFKIESAEEIASTNQLAVKVSAKNVGAGHNIPAGLSQERQVWIELEILDSNNQHVYTSGYLQPIEKLAEGEAGYVAFDRYGDFRYSSIESSCGAKQGALEYLCDLDGFRGALENNLEIASFTDPIPETPLDEELVNYQNGFTVRNGPNDTVGQKVFSQFIGNAIENGSALKPFEKREHIYNVNTDGHKGPFKVNARLRFRPLPHEFLAALKQDDDFPSSRVTDDVIKANRIIEMESDKCVSGYQALGSRRSCNLMAPLALGVESSCEILGNQTAQCWGKGNEGILGDGVTDNRFHGVGTPTTVIARTATNKAGIDENLPLSGIKQMALSKFHNCALKTDGTVYCWGDGRFGVLGDNNVSGRSQSTPRQIDPALLSNVKSISSGYRHSCAVFGDINPQGEEVNNVKCWGDGLSGSLGTGNENDQFVPTLIDPAILTDVEMIASGSRHNCALLKNGEVMCWGQGNQGQLGNNTLQDALTPTKVIGLGYAATHIAAAKTGNHTCAILANKQVKCWGQGQDGRLGDNITTTHTAKTPVLVQGLTFQNANGYQGREEMTMLALGAAHSCGLMINGTVKCWGQGSFGATGNDASDLGLPTAVDGLTDINYIAAGGYHTCAKRLEGLVSCFGSGQYGRLGDNDVSIHKAFSPSPIYEATPALEDFEGAGIKFINTGNVPWRRYSGRTPSGSTGPLSGAAGSAGYYYMETSTTFRFANGTTSSVTANLEGETAILETGLIDGNTLGSNARFSFDYHMYGDGIGELSVDLYIEALGVWVEDRWTRSGNQGDEWLQGEFDISSFAVAGFGPIKLRLRATAVGNSTGGFFYRGDIAIDNISLTSQ